jgi:hypothetical protein
MRLIVLRLSVCAREALDVLFRPKRVVRVTSKEELDSALASADQVIVEGDDRLLSYAAAKASHDPQLSSVDIQIGSHSISVGRDAVEAVSGDTDAVSEPTEEEPPLAPSEFEALLSRAFGGKGRAAPPEFVGRSCEWSLDKAPRVPHARKSSGFRLIIAFALFQVAVGVAVWFIWYFYLRVASVRVLGPQSSAETETPFAGSSSAPQVLQSLAWPAVVIVAIIALFLIARQAIAGGRNVEISWKVTEKVKGRVVITKVRSRAKSAPSAA